MIGMFSHLTEAGQIAAGMGCTFGEALDIVKAAHAEPEPIESNVIYGVDFANKKPKGETFGAL